MRKIDEQTNETEMLRDRLSRLSEASLRINESLDIDNVLHEIVESARHLTNARYGLITTNDDSGQVKEFLSSGLTHEESERLWALPEGQDFFAYLSGLTEPLRVQNFHSHVVAQGLPVFRSPATVSSFLAAPMRHRGEGLGYIFLAKKELGQEFSRMDEETLVMFASQAALVIVNARRYRDEQRARADLEALINTSPVGVVVFDAKTGFPVSVNRESRRILGDLCSPGESVEQILGVVTFLRDDGREVSLGEFPLSQALASAETVRAEEIVVQVPDGRQVTTLVNATPICGEEGTIESVVVTLQDMTPLKELERLRAEFLGMVSHELRTPLAAIKGSTATLRDRSLDLDPAEMDQFHRIIEEQAELMRDLVNDLLDVTRIESGTLVVVPEPIDVRILVDRARTIFLSSGREYDIQIDLPRDLPQVLADRRRIVQVLSNLIANASQFSPTGSTIWLTAKLEAVHVAVSVVDEGKGVPPERLRHLFRKFSRFGGEIGGGGSGLGLSISKGIVEAHGGRIWAESEGENQGTRFVFTLQLVAETVTAESVTKQEPDRVQQQEDRAKRILVVDDDPNALRYVRQILLQAGYTPIVTGEPREVDALIRKEKPHLVLLDLVLPGFDGIEMMERTPEIAEVPVIFLSAYGRDEIIAKAFEKGAVDYIVKPFSPTELVARIQAALRKRLSPGLNENREPYRMGGLTIDYATRSVSVNNRQVQLTSTEYNLLYELAVNAGRVLTHRQLLERVWDMEDFSDSSLVRSFVKKLRSKLADKARNPTYIFTEPRVGYRMAKAEDSEEMTP